MRNKYLENLNKLEFVVTNACTGRCRHCSEGEHYSKGESIDPNVAADAVVRIAVQYDIKTVMTFGGEPLLCVNTVEQIMNAATKLNIPKRQVITNGYFSNDEKRIAQVARRLYECGVNDLLLSVDAFHQETIPLDTVKEFAAAALECGIPIRLQPAWLVSPADTNVYNQKTKEILDDFSEMKIAVGDGNTVFPEGNALKYLSEYFVDVIPKNPYVEDSKDVRCVSFSPNGDVLDSNIYKKDIMEILNGYDP